jgi:hypothetical protein
VQEHGGLAAGNHEATQSGGENDDKPYKEQHGTMGMEFP